MSEKIISIYNNDKEKGDQYPYVKVVSGQLDTTPVKYAFLKDVTITVRGGIDFSMTGLEESNEGDRKLHQIKLVNDGMYALDKDGYPKGSPVTKAHFVWLRHDGSIWATQPQ